MNTDIETKLLEILSITSKNQFNLDRSDKNTPLRDLGIPSVTILNFLIGIEDSMGIEWPEDTPRESFKTINSIAEQLRPLIAND